MPQSGILDLGSVVGPPGPQGIPGNNGLIGPVGPQGTAGTMLYTVQVSTPDAPLGSRVGDFILSSATVNIAVGNVSSVAPGGLCRITQISPLNVAVEGSLRGPTGPQGATGNTGPQGPQGPQGVAPTVFARSSIYPLGTINDTTSINIPAIAVNQWQFVFVSGTAAATIGIARTLLIAPPIVGKYTGLSTVIQKAASGAVQNVFSFIADNIASDTTFVPVILVANNTFNITILVVRVS